MDGEAGGDIQGVGASTSCGDSLDMLSVGEGTAPDGAGFVREVGGPYTVMVQEAVESDTSGVEGRHSTRSSAVTFCLGKRERRKMGALLTWEDLGETPIGVALLRGRFCIDSESRGGGGGI